MTRAGLADDELAELRANKGDDSVVKPRPVVPANLRRSSSFGVEDTVAGRRPLRKLFSDESRILELSIKWLPADAIQTAAEPRAYLAQRGIDLSGEQQTKTRRALEFFSARLEK